MPGEIAATAYGEFSALDLVRFLKQALLKRLCMRHSYHILLRSCNVTWLQLYQQANSICWFAAGKTGGFTSSRCHVLLVKMVCPKKCLMVKRPAHAYI